MAYLPIEEVRGNHLKTNIDTSWERAVVSPSEVAGKHSEDALLSFTHRLNIDASSINSFPVYQITEQNNLYRYSAISGEPLSRINKDTINALAVHQYAGQGVVDTTVLINDLPQEVQTLTPPLWQVSFNDELNTRFYLDPNTGVVERVRTDTWRLFDFMWMLHIMDYKDRSNFNSPLLIGFSASALLFALTGIVLLYRHFRPRRRRNIFKRNWF